MAHSAEVDDELSGLYTKLWELDTNKCLPGVHYELDKQGYVTSARQVGRDRARDSLFTWVDEENVFSDERKTYKAFRALLDNYESEAGIQETVTAHEQQENRDFIDAIMESEVMKEVHAFLIARGKVPETVLGFKQLLYNMWFKLYRRTKGDRDFDSSGFEHVFVGETRGHSVIGLHNWIQIYLQEKRGAIDYKGYFRRGTDIDDPTRPDQPGLMTLQFTWKDGKSKPIGSSFIGTSPEFEIALYSVAFIMGKGAKTALRISDYNIDLHLYRLGQGLGTAYPQLR